MPESGSTSDPIVLAVPARLRRTGIGKRMVSEAARAGAPDDTLIKLVVKAFALRDKLLSGDGISIDALSAREKLTDSLCDPPSSPDLPRPRSRPRRP